MKRFLIMLCTFPVVAHAQNFDGLYHPEGQRGWFCDLQSLGQEGGALGIQDNMLIGVENTCSLTNPVNVRDMDAVLYDLKCEAEGETSQERALIARSDTGVIILRDGFAAKWTLCR